MLAPWLADFFSPDVLIAARSRKGSARPRETLAPLARRLKRRIDDAHDDEQPQELARMLRGSTRLRGKRVLISWRHATLPALARALGARRVPPAWPTRRYNWIWEIVVAPRTRVTFRILTQPAMKNRRRAPR
jgi:hypothetical protein